LVGSGAATPLDIALQPISANGNRYLRLVIAQP